MKFDDDYPTCQDTYVTLRVFLPDILKPDDVTSALGALPTESFAKGDPFGSRGQARRHSAWLLSSHGAVSSRDTRRHFAWLIERLSSKKNDIELLRKLGAELDISCYYLSVGQGGPTMSAEQMNELGRLGLDVWWDIYFASDVDAR